ncbi:MAG: preprotein translocase subunit SecA [Polyangiaceae bacterium]|nr:preprotein translocase subunit SecA [Polyangiaceae bacterium]
MLTWVAKKFFGTSNERAIRRMQPLVERINSLESSIHGLSDAELQAKTAEFKEKLDQGAKLDDILVEAFAVCREASTRVLGMRHYDVQLMGGMVLHQGKIAEMRTGEGKTLVATLACYLNALEGKGTHVVTVNDYLATRDAEWMGKLYNWLGLSTGVIVSGQQTAEKIRAYKSDITYGQNNEFGFDYLRDNMKDSALEHVQRALHFAIVDEVDSILIDEARTPLIISGPADAASDKYKTLNEVIVRLVKDEHYNVDEKGFSATFTDEGIELVQKYSGVSNLYDPQNMQSLHILNQLMKAHAIYKRDQHYMVSPDGRVMIIDEFTGRVLPGRRWSDGLHQAVEAKENVRIQEESRTMATITFQNLFRIYDKLGGMTGTGQTEATEFMSTYSLDVVTVPTNKPIQREDYNDIVYKTEREKFTAVVNELLDMNAQGRPVLVGTTSVEKSDAISRILKKKKIAHNVLNAKHNKDEAYVVAQAGRLGAITVSTNMAGRGTDIMLGGNPEMLARREFADAGRDPDAETEDFQSEIVRFEKACEEEQKKVLEVGGLHILGTERHESRRIDNQLRGRAGRQGDAGSSRFYLSLEDELMRMFGGEKVKNLMDRIGMPDDEPIEHPMVNRSVENAQRKVEERNFDIRKNTLEYDDVMNAQRKTLYQLRQELGLGRYHPDELDELGAPTGTVREVEVQSDIEERIRQLVAQLVGMFCENPPVVTDENNRPRPPTREELEAAGKLNELESLQHEAYHLWGVKLDLETRKDRTPGVVYDELSELCARGLSEQRERLLDLIDKVIASVIEESCPPRKLPEDWNWAGIDDAYEELFGQKLDREIHHLGEVEQVAQEVYGAAEKIYKTREEQMGVDLALRVFRHLYTQAIDQAWVDHLQNMEHLRDGIGLRGYGQRDPKNEYKKEGYNLFLNMMASVSSKTLERFFSVEIQGQEEIAEMERAAEEKHHAELDQAVARHVGDLPEAPEPSAAAQLAAARQSAAAPVPQRRKEPKVSRNDLCPCGSGKKFKACHGAPANEES